ncbi:MAG: flagellar hook-length control protein FliK [Idiomarina sp.]|nr:flagellar hook-length control protein FliK [Idiomarina sp.]
MQQLHSIMLAPMTTAKGARLADADAKDGGSSGAGDILSLPQATQKFAFHLDQLTELVTEPRSNDSMAVSELAITMLQTSDDAELSADEAWLSMVEELNSVASGELSLEQVSSRHGMDVAELENQLNHALQALDGDMGALIAQLQQVSGGKALPPATDKNTLSQPDLPISGAERKALAAALAESDTRTVGQSERIDALLKRVEELSPGQQRQFAASVNELMEQLAELDNIELSTSVAYPTEPQSLDDKTAQQLTELRATLQSQVRALLDAEVELSPRQTTQLDHYLALLDKIDQLPLQNILSERKDSQQIIDQLALQAPAQQEPVASEQHQLDINELLHAVQTLLNSAVDSHGEVKPEVRLQTVDMKALQGELNEMLLALENELDDVSRDELIALLQTQLQTLERSSKVDPDVPAGEQQDENLDKLTQLLSELNQVLDRVAADIRVIDASRQSEPGNTLPPVAQALAQVSQQLRAQVQAALQLQQEQGSDLDESDAGDFDNLRRMLSDSVTSATESRNSTTPTYQAAGLQTTQQGNPGQSASAQGQTSTRGAEQATQSAFETARQSQQAIDILGTGASERLRERVSVMFNSRTQAAEMRLDPPDLGRLNIRLNMNQDQATVSFQVTTPQAREALEQNLPRLRELLAEQGIQLADANVSEQQQGGSRDASTGQGQLGAEHATEADEIEQSADGRIELASELAAAEGRVDYFV